MTFIQPVPTPVTEPTWTMSQLPTQTVTDTAQPTLSPTETFTPQPSETPHPTFTSSPTFTDISQWTLQGPNEVVVPILLYHHIGISPSESPYYVSPSRFEQQMYLLHQWGYQTISVEMMIAAIKRGGLLPQRPIILTFDDGSKSVLSTALPIMQEYNFIGTVYLVNNYVGAANFLTVEDVHELYEAGWEIGSHGITHTDLTLPSVDQEKEIIESRLRLQRQLDLPVLTFAYPYGAYDVDSVEIVRFAGYIGAVGLGASTRQGNKNQLYLYRRDIKGTYDIQTFVSFLPWQEDMSNLPILTLVP
ncbi:MAG TPA: polysaccharide deacetylase family protein [Anaerolineales bacterium]|nr:polysaccharide deacetylase family protein [Anaerolineales bacterium]